MMNVNMTIRVEKPTDLTIESTVEQKAYFEKWDRVNRLASMVIKRSIFEGLVRAISSIDNTKTFFISIGKRYVISSKAEAGQLMKK